MADTLLQSYRKQFPADARSDEELTLFLGDKLSPSALAAHPDFAARYNQIRLDLRKANAPSLPAEFGRAVASGVDTVQAKLYDTAGLAGDVLGSKGLSQWGSAGYERNLREAAANLPTIESISDVSSAEDLARYTIGLVGSQAPQLATTIGGAVAGGLAGGPPGAVAGAGLMGFAQMQNRGELLGKEGVDQSSVVPTAIGVGTIGALLESLIPLKVTSKILKAVPEETAKKYFAQVLKEVPVNALEEGGTEVLQEITAMAGELYANRNNPKFNLTRDEVTNRLINAGAAGVILGGGTGIIPSRSTTVSTNNEGVPKPTGGEPELPETSATAGVAAGVSQGVPGAVAPPAPRAGDYTERLDDGLARAREQAALVGVPEYEEYIEEVMRGEEAIQKGNEEGVLIPNQISRSESAQVQAGVVPTAEQPLVSDEEALRQVIEDERERLTDQQLAREVIADQRARLESEQAMLPPPPAQPVQPATSPEAGVKPATVRPVFDLEQVDFENAALSEINTKKGRTTDEAEAEGGQQELPGVRMEDPFFELSAQRFSPQLGERLVSFAKGDQGNKSDTRRMTFFEDIETGQVIGLPTYYTSDKARGGKVYRVAALPGEKKGTTLDKLMATGRYYPVASIRLTNPVSATDHNNSVVFDDALQFEQQVIQPARAKMRKTASYAVDMTARMQAQGFTEEGETIEFQGEDAEEDYRTVVADALIEMLPKESVGGTTTFARDLKPSTIADTLIAASARPEYRQGVMNLMRDALETVTKDRENYQRFLTLDAPAQQQYLLTKIANETFDRIRVASDAPLSARVLQAIGGDDKGENLYSLPRTGQRRATRPEYQGRFNQVAERLKDLGFSVEVLKAIEKEMGRFNNRERLVVLSLFDTDNPSVDNLRLILHESAHALFSQLPKDFQEVLRQAINQLSDEQAGLFNSTDPRIRQSNPAGLSQRVLSEERLAEYLALRGVQKPVAQGVAADLMRFVKDLYFRLAIAVQRLLGRQPSSELALAYADNRMAAFEAGTPMAPMLNWVIPHQPEVVEDRFSLPERIGEKTETSVVVESEVAALNEVRAFENSIASMLQSVPGVNALADAAGGLMTWWRGRMRFSDVEVLRQAQLERTDPVSGQPLDIRPDVRIDQFQSEQNKAIASKSAYKLIQERYGKLVPAEIRTLNEVENAEALRVELAEDIKGLAQDYTNVEGMTARMTRDFGRMINRVVRETQNAALELGAISQQLVSLGETKESLKLYEPVFKKIFPPKELHGEKLFDFLDAMANDSRIDFTRSIAEIRQALIDSKDDRYDLLIQNTRESRARLATAVAYAKRNELVMLALELRKMSDLDRRARINRQLESSLQDAKDLGDALRDLPRAAIIEDRLATALKKKRRQAKKVLERKQETEARLGAIRAVIDQYRKKMQELAGPNRVHAPVVAGDGMEYWVPSRSDAKGLGEGFESKVLRVDSRQKITDRKTLEEHLARMIDWLESTTQRDAVYYQVHAQQRELAAFLFGDDIINSQRGMLGLVLSDVGSQLGAFGTPSSRVLEQILVKFASVERFNVDKLAELSSAYERNRNQAIKVIGTTPEFYKKNFYDRTLAYLEQRRDIVEKYPSDFSRQLSEAFASLVPQLKRDHAPILAGKEEKFFTALKKHIIATKEVSSWLSERDAELGGGVRDDALQVETKRGEFAPGIRSRIERGVVTAPRRISQDLIRVFSAMANGGWAGMNVGSIARDYNEIGDDVVRLTLQPYFQNPDVQWFMGELAAMRPTSPFNAPVKLDGVTTPEANPVLVSQAWEQSGGDIVTFAENLYEAHNGESDRGAYVQEVVRKVYSYFREMKAAREMEDRDTVAVAKDFKSMIGTFMFHSRTVEHWPASMFTYSEFDRHSVQRMNQKVAAQAAFGPEQERLEKAFNTLAAEVKAGVEKLENAQSKVVMSEPDKKKLERALEQAVGGKEELKKLRRLKELQPRLLKTKEGLIEYFRGRYSSLVPERALHQITSTLAGAIVNSPGTALGQFVEVFSPIFAYGASKESLKLTLRTLASSGKDIAGGLAEAFGMHFERVGKYRQMWLEYGQGDPAASIKLVDALASQPTPYTGDSYIDLGLRGMSLGFQKIQAALNVGIGRKDGQRAFTVPRLLAPFSTVSRSIHAAVTQNLWRMTDEYVARALDIQRSRGDKWALDASASIADWAKELGYKGQSAHTFITFFEKLRNEVGLDFHRLVQEGARGRRSGRETLLQKQTYEALMMFGIREMTTETNIATMPVQVFNNWALRTALPLNGWAIRRATKLSETLQYDADGRRSMQAFLQGLLALGVLGGGGLMVSMLVDLYNEELLKKKRNLRRLTMEGGMDNLALGILEHSTRVGTFGFWGELFNAAVNVSTGEGDNRGVTIDGRVIFVNTLTGLLRSTSNFIHQGFEADYANVIRPALFSAGGNGALQYVQLANGLFEDGTGKMANNQEARATARTNVGNWLRVIGRELGMEVRKMSGGYSTPTPMTPHITRMVLAAYGGDMEDFNQAYREAIAQARKDGKDDPARSVKESFASRHPLRSIFRTAPSETEYRRILSALPQDGREDVRSAVNLFNTFLSRIGGTPFDGKEVKKASASRSTAQPFDLNAIRSRAALFGSGF